MKKKLLHVIQRVTLDMPFTITTIKKLRIIDQVMSVRLRSSVFEKLASTSLLFATYFKVKLNK